MTGSDKPHVTGINHVTLVVSDIARAVRFYCDILGCKKRFEWERCAYLEAGDLWLCLELGMPEPCDDQSHLAFSCSASDYDHLVQRISATGTLWKDNHSEGASLYFLDPDGHKLELHLGNLASRLEHYRNSPPDSAIFND